MKLFTLLIGLCFFVGCTTFVPVRNLKKVPQSTLVNSARVEIFTKDNANIPSDFEFIEEIFAYSCKHLLTDPPATNEDALKRLKIEAYERGANAIIEVTFDYNVGTLESNCWEVIKVSGLAVKISNN